MYTKVDWRVWPHVAYATVLKVRGASHVNAAKVLEEYYQVMKRSPSGPEQVAKYVYEG